MGLVGAAQGWGKRAIRPPLPKICHTYPTMMKLGTIIAYLKKSQKIYKSRGRLNNKHGCNFDDVSKIGYSRRS